MAMKANTSAVDSGARKTPSQHSGSSATSSQKSTAKEAPPMQGYNPSTGEVTTVRQTTGSTKPAQGSSSYNASAERVNRAATPSPAPAADAPTVSATSAVKPKRRLQKFGMAGASASEGRRAKENLTRTNKNHRQLPLSQGVKLPSHD